MAKISANGRTEVARNTYTLTNPRLDGGSVQYDFVLCSDGVILKAVSWPNSPDRELRRKRYTVQAKAKHTDPAARETAFQRYCNQRRPLMGD